MPLNEKQKEAVEYLNGPLMVLAGPGTGKTQLLASKVEFILNNAGVNPENILCLTYTEAGVNAMRERLRSMGIEGAENVTIGTYHGFGSQILAEYRNYAESFPRVMDHPIPPVTAHKIVKEIIEDLPARDIIRATFYEDCVKDVVSTINEAKSARLTAEDLEEIAKDNIKMAEEINPRLDEALDNFVPRMKFDDAMDEVYLPLREILAEFVSDRIITKNIYPEINYLYAELNSLIETELEKQAECEAAKESGRTLKELGLKGPVIGPLNKWKDAHFEVGGDGHHRLHSYVANKKLLSVSNIMRKYDERLAETGQFDFADMIEESIHLLLTDAGFKATLQERFQYILLDEFQDTNSSQFELVHLLADYDNPDIMAVGDDDQAIYAFQGANVSNVKDFIKTYKAHVITLTENYRSTQEILGFSNEIASQIEDRLADGKEISKVLSSMRNEELMRRRTDTQIERHVFSEAGAEYSFIADKIESLIEEGVEQSEIAIIVPWHKYITPIIPYLKAKPNINISYEKRENILEDEKISELTRLVRFVYDISENRDPAHNLLEILSFDFWNIPYLKVLTAVQSNYKDQRRALDYLLQSGDEDLRNVAEFISELVKKSFTTPLEEFINLIANKIGSDFEFFENLSVLREALVAYLNKDKPRLADFIMFLDDYEATGDIILNTSPYKDSNNSVQVMTAHKSKGMEYEYVFLVSMDSYAWGKASGNNNHLSLPANLISIRHTGSTPDERLRLLFVAITRAKHSLFLTSSQTNFAGRAFKPLEYLKERTVTSDGSMVSPLLPNTDVEEHFSGEDAGVLEENLETGWLSHYYHLAPDELTTMQNRLEDYRLTASDLTTFIDVNYAGPLEFYKRKVLRAPGEPASAAIELGNLVHAVFEQVTNNGIEDTEATRLFEEEAARLDVSEKELADLLEQGQASLKASLPAFAEILRAENAKGEVNLSHEHLVIDDVPITGKIDHINIDEKNKTIEIYDFKTGNYHNEEWDKKSSLYKYRLQLGFYKLLLNLSPTYSKYKIEKAHILFVNPDSDGNVHDKVLEFDENFMKELRILIKKVYMEMKSLEFLDESHPLHQIASGKNNVKDIVSFVKNIVEK